MKKFTKVKLRIEDVKAMILTYECLKDVQCTDDEDIKFCKKILRALNKSLETEL